MFKKFLELALELSFYEAKDLLQKAGFALSRISKFDLVIKLLMRLFVNFVQIKASQVIMVFVQALGTLIFYIIYNTM